MITLENLHAATAQQVFDQVATHLLRQGQKSTDIFTFGTNCAYRGKNGLKCAAGCLISDAEYSKGMEGTGWTDLALRCIVPTDHCGLILMLQQIHDTQPPALWSERLNNLADSLHLNRVTV